MQKSTSQYTRTCSSDKMTFNFENKVPVARINLYQPIKERKIKRPTIISKSFPMGGIHFGVGQQTH